MHDHQKSKAQLIEALNQVRQQLDSVQRSRGRMLEELHQMMDLSDVFFCTAGFDGYFHWVNATFTKTLGYREEELLSRPAFEVIHPDDRDASRACLEKLAGGEMLVNFENRNICKDGSLVCLTWTVVPLPERGIVYGIAHDITEQKRAEQTLRKAQEELEQGVKLRTAELARTNQRLTREIRERKHAETTLQESEERFRSLVETTSDFIFEIDAEGIYTYVNPKAKDLTGYEPEELVGKSTFELMPADDARRNAALFRETVARGIPVPRAEVARLHKDGRRIIYETSCTPILDSAGQCRGYRGISRDITERKKTEEAIRKERQQLRRSLEASDQQRKLIAYEIHDGLTQHLSAAIMQFQTFSRLQSKEPEKAAKIYDVGMRMLGQSLSEARRLITGVRPPLLDDAGVVAAIENLIYEIASRGTETEIDFRCNVEFDRLEPALENGIYRIVQESLANLCRHANSKKARVEISQIEDCVRVVIRDWGIGFDPEGVSEKCYGLAGIRERARVLGGSATIQSTLGKGTKITVELSLIENRSALPPDRGPLQRRDDFV